MARKKKEEVEGAPVIREPRKDLSYFEIADMVALPEYNIRVEYGNLEGLEKSIEESPEKIPPLKGYKKKGKFYVTDGFRRLRAAQNVKERTGNSISLLVYKEPVGYTEIDRLADMFLLNEGKALTILEQAYGIRKFREVHNLSNKQIAAKIGKSPTHVRNCFLLLQSPEETQQYISNGHIKDTLVIELLKEHGIDKAVQIIHDTIENTRPAAAQLKFNMTEVADVEDAADEPKGKEKGAKSVVAAGGDDSDFHKVSAVDDITEDNNLVGSAVNASGFKTDEELGIGGKDDKIYDSDSGAEIKPVPIHRVTRKDFNNLTPDKFDAIGGFRRMWGEYKQKGWATNPDYYEEFVFVQRILDGSVSTAEMMKRYFKFTEEQEASLPFSDTVMSQAAIEARMEQIRKELEQESQEEVTEGNGGADEEPVF